VVARIKHNKSIRATLEYNEAKLQKGKAACIYAGNYLATVGDLTFDKKVSRLNQLVALNEAVASNCVHISLNFHPDDKLPDRELVSIAKAYMDGIGFRDQPYLVYRHDDAAHPHIHIVTVNIKSDGKKIDMFNIGKEKSELVRKQIEKDFHLTVAERKKLQQTNEPALKVQYATDCTTAAINKVLNQVLYTYMYTSIPELNAVLQLYNVRADTGNDGSKLQQRGGLVFKILQDGKAVGVGIKASDLEGKPTKKIIENICRENKVKRASLSDNIRDKIDTARFRSNHFQSFKNNLAKHQVHLVDRYAINGMLYGLTYIDHNTGAVFNGSDLGKQYSAKGISGKFDSKKQVQMPATLQVLGTGVDHGRRHESVEIGLSAQGETTTPKQTILDAIIDPVNTSTYLPWQLKRKKKKRKK
jgi:hypothetical protein